MSVASRFATMIVFLALHSAVHASDRSFIRTYVDARHGCNETNALLTFEQGAQNGQTPFGKSAADWTSEDLAALRATMVGCLPSPNGFDITEENQIVRKVAAAVEAGQADRTNQERQDEAARQMAAERAEAAAVRQRERAEHQAQQEAIDELRTFSGHVLSDAERGRVQQLRERFPRLATAVDALLSTDGRLRQEASDQAARAKEREDAARRIQAENAKRELDEQRAEQEAEIEAERQRDAFVKALPSSCKDAEAADRDLETGKPHVDYERAAALADAGDSATACTSFETYETKLEAVRAALVQCTKDLDPNLDALAREVASRSLNRAKELYAKQKALRQKMSELCQ